MSDCLTCGETLAPARGNRPRKYCDDRCRKANTRRGPADDAPNPLTTPVTDGLLEWLDARADLPQTHTSAAIALAAQIDSQPANSQLWSRYLAALTALTDAAAERERTADRVLADIRAEFATIEGAEKYRAERQRAAIDAGDENEARRWARLVPIGCVTGDHDWYRWPAGPTTCKDCRTDQDVLA